jgi:hypothetical protein
MLFDEKQQILTEHISDNYDNCFKSPAFISVQFAGTLDICHSTFY